MRTRPEGLSDPSILERVNVVLEWMNESIWYPFHQFSWATHYWCSLIAREFVPRSDKVDDKGLTLWNFMRLDFEFMRLDFESNVSCNKCVSHLAVTLSLQNWKRNRCSTWLDIVLTFDQIFNMNLDVMSMALKMRSRNCLGNDPKDPKVFNVFVFSGSTLSVRTSPAHGKDGSSSSAAPAPLPIPLQRSAVINNPMLPRNSQASHRNNDNEACIQVANIESDPSSPDKEYEICSSKNLCGPNPKKVTVIVALILSIWASFILGVNIHKKVSLLF